MLIRSSCALLLLFSLCCPLTSRAEDSIVELRKAIEEAATFEFGKNDSAVKKIESIAVASLADKNQREAVEDELAKALEMKMTRDAKDVICRQLRTVATKRSVPVLEEVLHDPALSHLARYALGRIEDVSARQALHRALAKTSGAVQAGIAHTLGRTRYREAASDLVKLLESSSADVSSAAATALGYLGGAEAVAALESARAKAAKTLGVDIDNALLACAELYVQAGDGASAAKIYSRFTSDDAPEHLRFAGLRGLVSVGHAEAGKEIVRAFQSKDPRQRALAIRILPHAKGDVVVEVSKLLHSFPESEQASVLRALGQTGERNASGAIIRMISSKSDEVRAAAIDAIFRVAGQDALRPVLGIAADRPTEEWKVFVDRLVALDSPWADEALAEAFTRTRGSGRYIVLGVLCERKSPAGFEAVYEFATAGQLGFRLEKPVITSLGQIAMTPEQVERLLEPMRAAKDPNTRSYWVTAARTAIDRLPPSEARERILHRFYESGRAEFVRLLRTQPSAESFELVRSALDSRDPKLSPAARETLIAWPNADAAPKLLSLFKRSKDAASRAALLDGIIRIASSSDASASFFGSALDACRSPGDRRLIIDAIAQHGGQGALDVAQSLLSDEDAAIRGKAANALVNIADRIRGTNGGRAKEVLRLVVAKSDDEGAKNRAGGILGQLEQYEGYILKWRCAGVFQQKGKDGAALFDIAFDPEKPDAKTKWKPMRRGIGAWNIDLQVPLGNIDNAATYMRTNIWSPKKQEAQLEIGADDAVKVWFNGKYLFGKFQIRGLAPRQDIVPVELEEGWNELKLKVVDQGGEWSFCCRVRQPSGAALEGLKFEAKK